MIVTRLTDTATLPTRKHETDAGLDLYSDEDKVIYEFGVVNTNVCIQLPPGTVGIIKPKSRHDFLIGGGVVDEGYRGPLMVKIIAPYNKSLAIKRGMPIAQLLVIPVDYVSLNEVSNEEFNKQKTPRGATGGILGNV